MKVAFDQQVFLLQEYGGISRYICSLAKHLSMMPDVDARVIAPLHFNRNLDALQEVPGKGMLLPKVNPKLFRLVVLVSKYLARLSINRFSPEIVHETYFSFDDYLPRGAKRVLTIYDMIHERYAAGFDCSHMTSGPKKAAALRADHVICISENTRRDLIELCGVAEEKTSVVYLGVDEEFLAAGMEQAAEAPTRPPFLLYVGSRDGYKNFKLFVKAFGSSDYLRENFSIICFGGGPLQANELSDAAAFGLRPGQLQHRSGSDKVLAQLYRQAVALVYPSLYEGFGIPPLEAMAVGCPVISSNTSSLPEVVGDAGEYFDPNSQEAMTAAIEHVLQSPSRREELVARGRQQCAKFSWEKCAQETMAVYRGLM
ncbi:MAG: glycosyltransferase family 1 protein [Thiobacillus sp.]|nr:glycosyltransferase family 1 protein [Thiobacillus sp.]